MIAITDFVLSDRSPIALRSSTSTLPPLARSEVMLKTFISCYRTPGPQKGFERVSEGVSEGVSEAFSKGSGRVLEGSSADPF